MPSPPTDYKALAVKSMTAASKERFVFQQLYHAMEANYFLLLEIIDRLEAMHRGD